MIQYGNKSHSWLKMVRSSISVKKLDLSNIFAKLEDKIMKFRPQCILLEQPTTTTTFILCVCTTVVYSHWDD